MPGCKPESQGGVPRVWPLNAVLEWWQACAPRAGDTGQRLVCVICRGWGICQQLLNQSPLTLLLKTWALSPELWSKWRLCYSAGPARTVRWACVLCSWQASKAWWALPTDTVYQNPSCFKFRKRNVLEFNWLFFESTQGRTRSRNPHNVAPKSSQSTAQYFPLPCADWTVMKQYLCGVWSGSFVSTTAYVLMNTASVGCGEARLARQKVVEM